MIRRTDHADRSSIPMVRGDIAIIGMSCTFPGARDLNAFWQNIVDGVDSISDVPQGRWDPNVFYDPDPTAEDKVYCKRGGYLGSSFVFNPLQHGIMPKAVVGAEPDQFLVLRAVHEAITDAGLLDCGTNGLRSEFILGRGNYLGAGLTSLIQRGQITEQTIEILRTLHPEYSAEQLNRVRKELKSHLPGFSAETAPGIIPNIATGRVANRLNMTGPNFTVDAACASSLVATELAVRDLLTNQCDLAIAGGVHVFTDVPFLLVFSALGALSRSGICCPFDANSDGTLAGEGVGIIVLKRLADAERAGDRIYAVIKGVGTSSDGKAVGVTAPRVEGEELALRRAYEMSGISPGTVTLIEAHGTGTTAGDRAELETISRVFGHRDGDRPTCALGAVKSMIGHAMPAAGAASIIKTALALHHRVLPPTLHCTKPHELLQHDSSRFYINKETRPWFAGCTDHPRRAGVNAFGFGGINAHLILEEYHANDEQSAESVTRRWDCEAIILEGQSPDDLIVEARRIAAYAGTVRTVALHDIAATLNNRLGRKPCRLAVVATDLADLTKKLEYAAARLSEPGCTRIQDTTGIYYFAEPLRQQGEVAFLFPGEGSQYVNMLRDLCIHFPQMRQCFDRADNAISTFDKPPLSADVFPPPFFSTEEEDKATKRLWEIDRATEAVLTADGAMWTLLDQLAIKPDVIAGHSAGEWMAMAAAGVVDSEEFLTSFDRLDAMYQTVKADGSVPRVAMLAIGADRKTVERLADEVDCAVEIANDNCPHQVVVVLGTEDADHFVRHLTSRGVVVERLAYDRGYHTPTFTYICKPLREYFSSMTLRPPAMPIYSCTTVNRYPSDPDQILDLVADTFARPLRFRETIEAMYDGGARIFVEVGPSSHLTGFVNDILRGRSHVAVAMDRPRRSGLASLNHAIALLAAHHVPMKLDSLYARRDPRPLSFDVATDEVPDVDEAPGTMQIPLGYPMMKVSEGFREQLHAQLDSTDDANKEIGKQPNVAPALQRTGAVVPHDFTSDDQLSGASASVMRQYFDNMERFLQAQRDVMTAYLSNHSAQHARTPAEQPPPEQSVEQISQPTSLSLETLLVTIVSEKTGYPPEMLDLNLDMEADLGIDSIKRVEILGALQQQAGADHAPLDVDLEQVAKLKTLGEVVAFLEGLGTGKPLGPSANDVAHVDTEDVASIPFTGRIVELVPGRRVVVTRRVDPTSDLYLEDHTLGPKVSAYDTTLGALPVVPLTISVEMMAEVASLLAPHWVVVGAKDIHASKWIDIPHDGAEVEIEITAEAPNAADQVRVAIRLIADENQSNTKPASVLVQATILLAPNYPSAPEPETLELCDGRTMQCTAQELYSKKRMFHGPRFQGVASLDRIGEEGLKATLEVLPRTDLLANQPAPSFQLDPCLLDAAGQLVGYWPLERLDEGYVVFPIRVSQLLVFKPTLEPGAKVECRVHIRRVTKRQLVADLDLIAPDGTLWMRIIGWEDWRFYWPKDFYEFWRHPDHGFAGESVSIACPQSHPDLQCQRFAPFGEIRLSIWENLWAHLILSRAERQTYRAFDAPRRRSEWLYGRAAAKDAVRMWAKKEHGLALFPADVEIQTDTDGKPVVSGEWIADVGEPPRISITHKDSVAIALAGRGLLGVDLEKIAHRDESFEGVAFSDVERALLADVPDIDHDEWQTRMWCAKEAAGKAIGVGIIPGVHPLIVRSLDTTNGDVTVSPSEHGSSPNGNGACIVRTRRDDAFIMAVAAWEQNGHGS